MKINYILLVLIIPIYSLAYQPICQNYFLIGSNRQDLKTFQKFNNERIKFYNENISNSNNPELQIRLINEQFKYELSLFYNSMEQIKTTKKALKLKKVSSSKFYVLY